MRRLYIKDKDGNYVPAPIIRGNDGREVSLRATDTHIQWKYDDTEWTNLVALSELKGKQGDKGAVGAHFTPSVSDDGVLSWTNNGELANPQPVNIRGPQGVQGEQGRGLTILGYYDTLAILQSSVLAPNGGDAYGVGTTPPYEIYIWDAVNGQWKPNGKLSGPNEVTSSTATNLTGLLKGNGTNVEAAVPEVDYATPEQTKAFVVTFTENTGDLQGTYTSDKTLAEIAAAYNANKNIIGRFASNNNYVMRLVYVENESFIQMGYLYSNGIIMLDPFSSNLWSMTPYDFVRPPYISEFLPESGDFLSEDIIYNASSPIGTYVFTPPEFGWAHGTFTTGTAPNITFTGKIVGKLPTFEASKQYEFDVLDGAWVVQEVLTQ